MGKPVSPHGQPDVADYDRLRAEIESLQREVGLVSISGGFESDIR